ncbi:hypothetical protein MSG28_007948 [Choristoneura fumiferana]|uniref:Uncharacterized protein n=1 Tax=Choristoneura fumiferana TaxID=7141 RepID=A0ACC0J9C4_CHOFU|nr:hypothetical protein MSG28_007948 [Choristoneura fumiferana]
MGHSLTNQVDMQKLNESVVTSIKNKINYFGDRSNLHGVGHVVSQTPIPGFKSKELPPTLTPFFKEVFFYNNKYCKTCMTCKMNSTCVENFLELAEATTSDVSINLLDPVKRGCLLVHEKPAFAQHWPFPRYSYNACVLVLVRLHSLPTLRVRRHAIRDLLGVVAPMAHCSVAQCSLPCRGAAPPPSCPDTIPQCASGCACMADCEQQAIVCFETKHCVQRKKYYARTMKHKGAYARVD